MTEREKRAYRPVEELRETLSSLAGQKFKLDCGHHITFHHNLGSSMLIHNDRELKLICSLCGY